jgi:Glutathione peroxidase
MDLCLPRKNFLSTTITFRKEVLVYRLLCFVKTTHDQLDDNRVKEMASFYELTDRDMDGTVVPMSKFQGKVLLLVNVAST